MLIFWKSWGRETPVQKSPEKTQSSVYLSVIQSHHRAGRVSGALPHDCTALPDSCWVLRHSAPSTHQLNNGMFSAAVFITQHPRHQLNNTASKAIKRPLLFSTAQELTPAERQRQAARFILNICGPEPPFFTLACVYAGFRPALLAKGGRQPAPALHPAGCAAPCPATCRRCSHQHPCAAETQAERRLETEKTHRIFCPDTLARSPGSHSGPSMGSTCGCSFPGQGAGS